MMRWPVVLLAVVVAGAAPAAGDDITPRELIRLNQLLSIPAEREHLLREAGVLPHSDNDADGPSRRQVDGTVVTDASKYPYAVNIVQLSGSSYAQRCTGALITPNAVLSAAHCFFEEQRVGVSLSETNKEREKKLEERGCRN